MPVACGAGCKARTRSDEGATLRQPFRLEGSDDSFHRASRVHHAARRRGGVADSGAGGAGVKAANYRPLQNGQSSADRAGDISDRIRDHIKKAPPRKGRFDLNKAIDEVIALAESAIATNGISVRTHLAEALLPVQGD